MKKPSLLLAGIAFMGCGLFADGTENAVDVKKAYEVKQQPDSQCDYKAILNKYSKAYSGMDEKQLAEILQPQELKKNQTEFAKLKKAGQKPELTLIYQYQRQNGQLAVLDVLESLALSGNYLYRNGRAIYTFDKEKLSGKRLLFNAGHIGYFWDALLNADEIGILNAEKRGSELQIIKFLPDKKFESKIKFPDWLIYQVRGDGQYLVPLQKTAGGYAIPGRHYDIPPIKDTELQKYMELFEKYKKLNPADENNFLKEVMLNKDFVTLRDAAMKRLAAMGEFNYPLDKKDMLFWQKVFSLPDTTIMLKLNMLYQLNRSNFLPDNPIFVNALKDPQLSMLAARFFLRRNRKEFQSMMTEWLNDPQLRQVALSNSTLMTNNKRYITEAMKYFDLKTITSQELKYYIPLLAAAGNTQGETILKNILVNSKDFQNYSKYLAIILEISKYNPEKYSEELKVFLKKHQKDQAITKGMIYPLTLYCLCKANDEDGYKMALEYLKKLEAESGTEKGEIHYKTFYSVFYRYNPKLRKVEDYQKDFEANLVKLKKLNQHKVNK